MTVTAMRQSLADFDESRNRARPQAFVSVMTFERPIASRTKGSMSFIANWTDFSPTQAGLAAALRRAFTLPDDETAHRFDELLRRLH
jgi:hypothetical protein